jgi:hypothetical protein
MLSKAAENGDHCRLACLITMPWVTVPNKMQIEWAE